jgi:AcrR family transcriptional regulator
MTSSGDRKGDRRVQRTRDLLLDALVSLLMERGYEKLTIQNLIERAGVGRATFYSHFQSKDELLSCSLERLRSHLTGRRTSGAAAQGMPPDRLGFALPFFEHIDSHRRIYHATIGRESEWTVEQKMQRLLRELAREDLERGTRGSAAALDLAVRYVVGTMWALVVWWMESRNPLSAEAVNGLFRNMTDPALDAIFRTGP